MDKPNPNCPICKGRGWYYDCATYPELTNNTFRVDCDCNEEGDTSEYPNCGIPHKGKWPVRDYLRYRLRDFF